MPTLQLNRQKHTVLINFLAILYIIHQPARCLCPGSLISETLVLKSIKYSLPDWTTHLSAPWSCRLILWCPCTSLFQFSEMSTPNEKAKVFQLGNFPSDTSGFVLFIVVWISSWLSTSALRKQCCLDSLWAWKFVPDNLLIIISLFNTSILCLFLLISFSLI